MLVGTVGVSCVLALLAGCATNGPDANEHPPLADSQAGLGQEQTDWGTPFWERWIDEARGENTRASSTTAQSASAPQTAAMHVGHGLLPKVGVYIDRGDRNSLAASQLINSLDRHAAEHGLAIIKPDALVDAVGQTSACSSDDPLNCPQVLSIYPGIRTLLVVHLQSSGGDDEASVETRMLDTDFGIEYQPTTTRLSLAQAGSQEESSNLSIWSNRVLGLVQDRVGIAPWFAHSFALDGKDLYLNAGRNSGLDINTTLVVHDGGSVIRAPGGRIIAWKPGPAIGRVQIKQFIGQHVAIAQLVSGHMPKPQDKLTVEGAESGDSQ